MTVERMLELMVEFKIDAEQFLLCYIRVKDDPKLLKLMFNNYLLHGDKLQDLEKKGLIMVMREEGRNNIAHTDIIVQPKFKDVVFVEATEAAQELYDCYFVSVDVNGNLTPARNISVEELAEMYINIYQGNKDEHDRIIRLTKKFVNGRRVGNLGLEKFVKSRYWESVSEEQSSGDLIRQI